MGKKEVSVQLDFLFLQSTISYLAFWIIAGVKVWPCSTPYIIFLSTCTYEFLMRDINSGPSTLNSLLRQKKCTKAKINITRFQNLTSFISLPNCKSRSPIWFYYQNIFLPNGSFQFATDSSEDVGKLRGKVAGIWVIDKTHKRMGVDYQEVCQVNKQIQNQCHKMALAMCSWLAEVMM